MDYEKRYNEALSRAKDMLAYKEVRQEDMEYLFPELKESGYKTIFNETYAILDYTNKIFCIMDYKELYTEALERARELSKTVTGANYEYIFPELKESEDEKMKTAIKHVLYENYTDAAVIEGVEIAEIVAWLEEQGQTFTKKDVDDAYLKGICDAKHEIEKQGEKLDAELGQSEVTKTSDQELEPKFKVGDWITDGYLHCKITEILDDRYIIEYKFSERSDILFEDEDCYYLWSIQDAKDGDVLVCPSDLGNRMVVFIFKQLVNHASEIDCHCCIDANGIFDPCLNDCYVGDVSRDDYAPATKEQRDLLFQKMKQAGYEWDSKNKELKRIGHKTLDSDKVIAWLVANICGFDYYVRLFKQDFEL